MPGGDYFNRIAQFKDADGSYFCVYDEYKIRGETLEGEYDYWKKWYQNQQIAVKPAKYTTIAGEDAIILDNYNAMTQARLIFFDHNGKRYCISMTAPYNKFDSFLKTCRIPISSLQL